MSCESVKNWCTIQAPSDEVDYTWTISKFDFHEAEGQPLESPTFSAKTNDNFEWYLLCKPKGRDGKVDAVGIYLCSSTDLTESIFVKFTIFSLDQQRTTFVQLCPERKDWGWSEFIKKDENFRNKISQNNELTIHCSVQFSELKNYDISFRPFKPTVTERDFFENLAVISEKHEFSDVTISAMGKDYQAHKIILAARSPVFAAMFRHNMKENEQNRVLIEDVNADVMDEVLKYMYSGKCQNLKNFVEKLFVAADKYSLDGLKMICIEELFKKLSVENAANILALADSHGATKLKDETVKFIVSRFADVANSTAWKNLPKSHPELISEVCLALYGRVTELNK